MAFVFELHCSRNSLLYWIQLPAAFSSFSPFVAGTPTICVTVWATLRLHFDDTSCWDTNNTTALWWVIKGPTVVCIMINFVLFVGIIVILVQKLQSPDIRGNESSIYLSCAQKCFSEPTQAVQHSCRMSELSAITL
eukprot:XP_014038592.1 PREDICTED: pituitary adenylate cyclase-activating polypeptide type I receptor-like [Salmo salar]